MLRTAYQVNQNNRDETASRILCAPDDGHPTHAAMRALAPGDLLFHYDSGVNSKRSVTHAISVIEEVDVEDARLNKFRNKIHAVTQVGVCFFAYEGAHLTQQSADTRLLIGFSRP